MDNKQAAEAMREACIKAVEESDDGRSDYGPLIGALQAIRAIKTEDVLK